MASPQTPDSRQRAAATQTVTKPAPSEPSARRSLLSRLLLAATVSSLLSTLAFLGYLALPALEKTPRSNYAALYAVGAVGLVVAEACQALGVLALLGRWFSRANTQKKPKEFLVLLVSLIPYMLVVILVITVIVYLRARRQNPASQRTRDAAKAVREQFADTFVDAGSNVSSSAVGSPPSAGAAPASSVGPLPAAQPSTVSQAAIRGAASPGGAHVRVTMRDAVRQVIGPSTGKSLSESSSGLLAVTAVALVLTAVATVGVVVPAKGLAPLQASVTPSPTSPCDRDRHACLDPDAPCVAGKRADLQHPVRQ